MYIDIFLVILPGFHFVLRIMNSAPASVGSLSNSLYGSHTLVFAFKQTIFVQFKATQVYFCQLHHSTLNPVLNQRAHNTFL